MVAPSICPPFAAVGVPAVGISIIYQKTELSNQPWVAVSPDGKSWTSNNVLSAEVITSIAVGATAWNLSAAAILFVGSDGTLWYATEPPQNLLMQWWPPAQLPPAITTLATPSLTIFQNRLTAAFLSSAGDNQIWMSSSQSGKSWDLTALYGSLSNCPPAIAVLNNTLYVLFKSSGDNTLFVTSSTDGKTFQSIHLPPALTTVRAPALATLGDMLVGIFCSSSDTTLWAITSLDGNTWALNHLPSGLTTNQPPVVAVFNGVMYVFAANPNGSISQVSSKDGQHWSSPNVLPDSIGQIQAMNVPPWGGT